MPDLFRPDADPALGGAAWTNAYRPVALDFQHARSDIAIAGADRNLAGYCSLNVRSLKFLAGALPGTAHTVTAASWASSAVTYTIGSHAVIVGQRVTITGASPSGYNVSAAAVTAVTGTTFTVAVASNPGTWTSGGSVLVGSAPVKGETAVDASGVLWTYSGSAWTTAAWASDQNANGHNLANVGDLYLATGKKLGIGAATPESSLDSEGLIRIRGLGAIPTTGAGVEIYWSGTYGVVQAYDRAGAALAPLKLWGSRINVTNGVSGYASDAAAGTGGLGSGDLYYNTSTNNVMRKT